MLFRSYSEPEKTESADTNLDSEHKNIVWITDGDAWEGDRDKKLGFPVYNAIALPHEHDGDNAAHKGGCGLVSWPQTSSKEGSLKFVPYSWASELYGAFHVEANRGTKELVWICGYQVNGKMLPPNNGHNTFIPGRLITE